MTQEELARRSGIHPTYISHLESGRRNLTWTAMRKISEGLGIPAAELVQRTEELERAR
jgi:transcriptional regulator with XRE-family HTH domain